MEERPRRPASRGDTTPAAPATRRPLLHGELVRKVVRACHVVHQTLGPDYLESVSEAAVAKVLRDEGLPLDDEGLAEEVARNVDLSALDRDRLSTHAVGEAASKVAVMPAVRRALVEKQREFSRTPPGAVLDGRDIGTVVCPKADVKLYVTASAEVRAARRTDEIVISGGALSISNALLSRAPVNAVEGEFEPASDATTRRR